MNSQVPVLLFGSYLTALGTMRSLSRVGIMSYCVTEQQTFVTRSRFYKKPPQNYKLITKSSELRSYLNDFPADNGVLIPCSDEWTRAIVELETSDTKFNHSLPSRELISRLVRKDKFEDLLAEHNIYRPKTFKLSALADIDPVFNRESGNWFIKPVDSQSFFSKYGVKAFRVGSVEEATTKFNQITSDQLSVVLQEYIPGPASAHFFVDGFADRHGILRTVFCRQRNRIYPPDFGDSSYMTSISLGAIEPAREAVTSLVKKTGYRGIFSGELKYDHRDCRYKLLEINARPWAYIEFATNCGVNVAQMAYLDALKKDVPSIDHYSIGKSAIVMPNDLRSFYNQPKDQRQSLFSWLVAWFSAKSIVFSWTDPGPAISRWIGIIAGKVNR